jgi:macrodomain Ter protein organizer (MatP/YcbG family)
MEELRSEWRRQRYQVGRTKQVNVRLPIALAEWLERRSREVGKTVSYTMQYLLEDAKRRDEASK